jgi:hypothetical protein
MPALIMMRFVPCKLVSKPPIKKLPVWRALSGQSEHYPAHAAHKVPDDLIRLTSSQAWRAGYGQVVALAT